MSTGGASTNLLRSAFVAETSIGTTPATPAFKTMHTPAIFDDGVQRFQQLSQVGHGGPIGDTLLDRDCTGKITDAPLVYALYDPLIETLMQGAWASDVLIDGIVRSAVTVENSIPAGIGGASTMKRYRGVEGTGCTIKVDAEGKITFSMDLMGVQSIDSTTTAITGATYTDPVNNDPFSSTGDFTSIVFAGGTYDDIVSMELGINFTGRDPQPKIGGDVLVGIARGAPNFVLKVKFYVDTNVATVYDLARQANQTATKITISIGSVTLKKYKFELWKTICNKAAINYTANGNAFIDAEFQVVYSAANSGFMTITRAIA